MSLLDRIAAAHGDEQRADTAAMITAHQGTLPRMYSSPGVLPSGPGLAEWMQAEMDSAGGLLLTRRP